MVAGGGLVCGALALDCSLFCCTLRQYVGYVRLRTFRRSAWALGCFNVTTIPSLVQADDVVAARELLRDVISPTPMLYSRVLSDQVGGPVYLKCENLQRTGSFKVRGA